MITAETIQGFPATRKILFAAISRIEKMTGIKVELMVKIKELNVPADKKIILQQTICRQYQMPWHKIISQSRKDNLVEAREVYMYFSKNYLFQSSTKTGADLGFRDHTTILSGLKRINDLIDCKDEIVEVISSIKKQLPYDM